MSRAVDLAGPVGKHGLSIQSSINKWLLVTHNVSGLDEVLGIQLEFNLQQVVISTKRQCLSLLSPVICPAPKIVGILDKTGILTLNSSQIPWNFLSSKSNGSTFCDSIWSSVLDS